MPDFSWNVDYDARYEAIDMLREVQSEADERLGKRIARAVTYLRDTAQDSLPWGDVLPNKDSYGRRHGRFV